MEATALLALPPHSTTPGDLPVVGFISSQSGAVDARLLPRAASNHLTIPGVADRVGLRVLDSDGGHNQVSKGSLG